MSAGSRARRVGAVLLTVVCACSQRPELTARPSPRIVSLTPSITAIVDGLGKGAHLVGVTRFCNHPGVEVVGDMQPQIERVLALEPDLVVAARYGFNGQALDGLRASGLEVVEGPLASLADYRTIVQKLGSVLGASAAAGDLVRALDLALEPAESSLPGSPPSVLLVFELVAGHVYTTGGGDHLAEIVAAVGGRNVAEGGPLTRRLSLEQVEMLAPEVIVHTNPSERFADDAAALAFWQTMPGLPAVKARRVYVWPDDSLAQLTPRLPDAIHRLGKLVHGGAPR